MTENNTYEISIGLLYMSLLVTMFPNRSDTNRAVQAQKIRLDLEILGLKRRGIVRSRVVKTKVLISFAVTAKLICTFVFAYANVQFSHDADHLSLCENNLPQIRMNRIVSGKLFLVRYFHLCCITKT